MGKLYVFGCSYSSLYEMKLLNDPSINEYYKFRGGNFPKTWSEILSEDLDLELVNMSEWGFDNYSIFENMCKVADKITANDVVIIGWTQVIRFRLFSERFNQFRSINVWDITKNQELIDVSKDTIQEIIINRDNERWVKEVYNWMNVINRLSKLVKFKLIYWSFFPDFAELYIMNDLFKLGAETITQETNNVISNWHFGERGHEIQAKYFMEIVENKRKLKLI